MSRVWKTALVIGNTDGIGLGLTHALLAREWRVVGISQRGSGIDDPMYAHHVVDVGLLDYRERLREIVDGITGGGVIDVCVYCAGIGGELDFDALALQRRVFDVNLVGLVTTLELVLPSLRAAGDGHLIALSSLADILIVPDAPSYAASKAAISAYVEGRALSLRREPVAVTNVRFGFVNTKMASAPVRPLMISVERAVQVLLRVIERRPVRVSYPRMAALIARLAAIFTCVRVSVMRQR